MRRAQNEDGFAMVAAIVILAVIMGLGLGLLQFADAQQKASTREQASEAAFNVAEAALNAQVGQLDRKWPFKQNPTEAQAEMPRVCTSGATTEEANDCPSLTDLKPDPNTGSTTCSGTDAWGSPLSNQWTTYVRQDVTEGSGTSLRESSLFNSEAEKPLPSYASSEAGALWVRSVGVVQCHPVVVISLVTRQRVKLQLPPDAIAGNWFKVTNKGNKVIVDRTGKAAQPASVSMRCDNGSLPLSQCEQYDSGSNNQVSQVSPSITPNEPSSQPETLTATERETIKSEAQAYGTFYSSSSPPYHCPTSMNELQGVELSSESRAPVYIEDCVTAPNYKLSIAANGTANTEANPGFLVIANGTFELSGTSTYYGVIYAANLNPSPENKEAVVTLKGRTTVVGGIIVDGEGGILFGSSGNGGGMPNLEFDALAINKQSISAGAAATRNSFRILPSGQ